MNRFRVLALLLASALSLVGWTPSAAARAADGGGVQSDSRNRQDYVFIRKITPRTGADIPLPSKLPFTLEVEYRLASTDRGTLVVRVVEWITGRDPGKAASGSPALVDLVEPIRRTVRKGSDRLEITTPPVVLKAGARRNRQVLVVAQLQDGHGEFQAWAASYNFLRGSLVVRPSNTEPRVDHVRFLSYHPRPGELAVGNAYRFTFDISYSLKSREYGFVNLEFGRMGAVEQGYVWYTAVVPIPAGTGLLKVKLAPHFILADRVAQDLLIQAPLRIDPLGGTVEVHQLGPWKLVPADEG